MPDVTAIQKEATETLLLNAQARTAELEARLLDSEDKANFLAARLNDSRRELAQTTEELRESYAALKAATRKRCEAAELLLTKGRECREKQRQLAAYACELKVTQWKAEGLTRLLAAAEDERARRAREADAAAASAAELRRLQALVTIGQAEVQGIRWELRVRCDEVNRLRMRLALYEPEAQINADAPVVPAAWRSPAERAEPESDRRRRCEHEEEEEDEGYADGDGEDDGPRELPSIVISSPSHEDLPALDATEAEEDDDAFLTVPRRQAAEEPEPELELVPEPAARENRELARTPSLIPRPRPRSAVSERDGRPRSTFSDSTASTVDSRCAPPRRVLQKKQKRPETVDGARPSKMGSFWPLAFRRRNLTMSDLRHSWS